MAEEQAELEMEVTTEIKKVEKDAKFIISSKRSQETKKLEILRKLNLRKKKKTASQIETLRFDLAMEMMDAQKIGDAKRCNPGLGEQHVQDYCNEMFYDDYEELQDCYLEQNFCFMCCDNEFGGFEVDDRKECVSNCEMEEVDVKA